MKKSQIFTVVTFGLAALLLSCVLIVGLTSDGFAFSRESGPLSESLSYDVDLGKNPVDSLDITWQDGPITLTASPDENIHVIESARKPISDSDKLELSVKSGTLTLSWDGKWYRRFFTIGLGQLKKSLEVQLPKALAGELESVEISNTSGDIALGGLTAEDMEISSVSGKLELSDCTVSGGMVLNNVSGGIRLTGVSGMEKLDINTVSGELRAELVSVEELVISSVSGSMEFSGEAGEVDAHSVSGNIDLAFTKCPGETELDAVSGELYMELPAGSEFTADYDTLSGLFRTDFAVEELKGDSVRAGAGTNRISMSTTSGNMEIALAR